jgi:carotenoid cleavage dioxygenase-like enzyme
VTSIDHDEQLSPFLQGYFAPVPDELDVDGLAVTGQIPPELEGTYVRNGFNQAFPPIGHYHLFDGDGMLHAVDLRGGTARYRNRYIESKGLLAERRAGRALFGGLSELVMPDPEVMAEVGMLKNTANTHIIRHAGRHLALMEACPPTEVTASLDTVGEYDFDGRLAGAMTAHPKIDPVTGELLFFGYGAFPPFLRFHVADATGALVRSVDVDLPRAVMMHDFVVTQHYAVFFDLPAVFDVPGALAGGPIVSWQPDQGARIGVLPRSGSTHDLRWFDIDPCYIFHFVNGWDEEDQLVVDACRAPGLPIGFGDPDDAPSESARLHRWTIDLATGTVRDEPRSEHFGDFPRINDAFAGSRARYGYLGDATRCDTVPPQFTGLARYDLHTGDVVVHRYGDRYEAGEPVFAADPDRTGEDEGWILQFVYDRETESSDLVIHDARDIEGEPTARVHLPRRVPFGAHGNWMADRT